MKGRDILRAFAMSTQMVESEIRDIEKEHKISLKPRTGNWERDELFRRFDESLRTEALEMARHYATFYCLERSIRELISDVLEEANGPDWWSASVPDDIRADVEKNIQREREAGITQRSEFPIDYTTFGQLSGIISQNWDVFAGTLRSRKGVERVLWQLNLLRGPIAHCTPLPGDEVDRLRLAMKDWLRQVSGLSSEEGEEPPVG